MDPVKTTSEETACSTLTGMDSEVRSDCEQIGEVQKVPLTANTNQDIEDDLARAMTRIQRSARDDLAVDVMASTARSVARKSYQQALVELQTANKNAESGRVDSYVPFDPTAFLINYDQAQRHQAVGCPSLISPNQVSGDQWAEQNSGTDSCVLLLELDKETLRLVETTQFVPTIEKPPLAKPRYHKVSLGSTFGPVILKQKTELDDFDVSYFSAGASVGYNYLLHGGDMSTWLAGSGPALDVAYSYVGGDIGNLGSHRHQVALMLGWRQTMLASDRFFIEPQAGVAAAANWLNFGRGYPLTEETSLMGVGDLAVGYGFCGKDFCLEASLGYFYETTLVGAPDYFDHGPQLQLGVIPNGQ